MCNCVSLKQDVAANEHAVLYLNLNFIFNLNSSKLIFGLQSIHKICTARYYEYEMYVHILYGRVLDERNEMWQFVWLTCSLLQYLGGGGLGVHTTTEKQRPQQEQSW